MAHDSAASALTVMLFGLAGLLLLYAASLWVGLSKHTEGASERPAIPVHRFRSAAGVTAVALGLLGVTLIWLALTGLR